MPCQGVALRRFDVAPNELRTKHCRTLDDFGILGCITGGLCKGFQSIIKAACGLRLLAQFNRFLGTLRVWVRCGGLALPGGLRL
jgi:hypothetical protein